MQELHDKYRHTRNGKPTFERIERAAAMMDKFGVEYNILTVVHNDIANRIEEVYGYYKQKGWNYQQYIACLDPLYETPGQTEYALLPKNYGQFLIKLFNCWYEDVQKGKQPYIRQFENYVSILLGRGAEACDQRGSCGIQYVIEADGSVYPCDFFMLDQYTIGNINTSIVDALDEKRKEIRFVEESYQIAKECKDCQYYQVCRNGCQRNRIKTEEDLYKNYLCEGYKEFFKECLPRLTEIADDIRAKMERSHK